MSLVVEDGYGISDANSYVTVRFADDYLAYRTDFDWSTRTIEQKQAALVQATAYVDARYGRLFAGRVATPTQALAWPRSGAGYDNTLPVVLKRAVVLYAAYAAVSPLAPAPAMAGGLAQGIVTEKTVGPISKKFAAVTKGYGSQIEQWRMLPEPDALINQLISGINAGNRCYR
nr:MAG TPA: Putative Head Tail Connector Protein [Caudoviricetes sp.]